MAEELTTDGRHRTFDYESGYAFWCKRQGCLNYQKAHYAETEAQVEHIAIDTKLELESQYVSAQIVVSTTSNTSPWYVIPMWNELGHAASWSDYIEFDEAARRAYQTALRLNSAPVAQQPTLLD